MLAIDEGRGEVAPQAAGGIVAEVAHPRRKSMLEIGGHQEAPWQSGHAPWKVWHH